MNKSKINNILNSDNELESLLSSAMHNVGRAYDRSLIEKMKAIDEDDFRAELIKSKIGIPKVPIWKRIVRSNFARAAAACIVCVLLIWGIGFVPFAETNSSGYASMFNKYYTEYNATPFDAKNDRLNINGEKSTAQLIQDASELLSQKSRRNTKRSIEILEWLLDNNWRKTSLDPEIHWYLGLAYLKDGQKAKAKTQLEIVRATGKMHADEAASLLKEIGAYK